MTGRRLLQIGCSACGGVILLGSVALSSPDCDEAGVVTIVACAWLLLLVQGAFLQRSRR
jgi:hypothetical protein